MFLQLGVINNFL